MAQVYRQVTRIEYSSSFFSLKEKSKRRGMGLYIARECAQFNGGSLTLDPEPNGRGKFSKFIYA